MNPFILSFGFVVSASSRDEWSRYGLDEVQVVVCSVKCVLENLLVGSVRTAGLSIAV